MSTFNKSPVDLSHLILADNCGRGVTMSGIKLVPEEGGETITVPDASTVIGRGPFLKVGV